MDATLIVLILIGAVLASHASGVALGRTLEREERARRRRVGTPQ